MFDHTLQLLDANASRLSGPVALGDYAYDGPSHDGGITFEPGTPIGGSIIATNGVAFDGTLTGHGTVSGMVTGSGTITADGELTLGDGTAATGFDFDGTLNVGANHVTLLSGISVAFLGSHTTLDGGLLESVTGFEVGNGEVITGHGLLLGTLGGQLDNATLSPTGTINLSNPFNLGNRTVWLLANGPAFLTSTLTLAGGTLNGSTGASLQLSGSGTVTGFGAINLPVNATTGLVTVAGGTLAFAQSGTFGGSVTATEGNTLQLSGSGSSFLAGVDATLFALTITGGTTLVESGAGLAANNIEVSGGTLTYAAGSTANLAAAALTVSSAGTASLNSVGTLVLPTTTIVSGDGATNGTLTGTGNWALSEGATMSLRRAVLGGTGTLTVAAGAQLEIIGNGATLDRDIVNQGLVRLNAAMVPSFFMGGEATLTNESGATFRVLDEPLHDAGTNYNSLRATGLDIFNAGTMSIGAVSPQTGNAALPWFWLNRTFTNTGTLALFNRAIFSVEGAFTNSGAITLSNDSQLAAYGGGTFNGTLALGSHADSFAVFRGATVHDTGATFSGAGYLSVEGGTLHTQGGEYLPAMNLELLDHVSLPEATGLAIGNGRWLRVSGNVPSLPVRVTSGGTLELVGGSNTNAVTIEVGGTARIGSSYHDPTNHVRPEPANLFDAVGGQPGRGDIDNHGMVMVVPGTISGTGRLLNRADGTVEAVSEFLSAVQEMRLETINEGQLTLHARDEHPNAFPYSGGIRFGDVTNTGTVSLRATELTSDLNNDVSVRLGLSSLFTFGGGSRLLLNGSGADVIQAGTSLFSGGITTPSGTTIELRNRTLNGGITMAVDGTLVLGAGAILERWAGALAGSGTVQVADGGHLNLYFDFNGSGPGLIQIDAGGRLTLNGSREPVRLHDRPLVNYGTVDHVAGTVRMNGGTSITNHGIWNDSSTDSVSYASDSGYSSGGQFINYGTFNKNGILSIDFTNGGPAFTNHGVLNINAGPLTIATVATFSGTSVVNFGAGATLTIHGDSTTSTLQSGARFQGAGTIGFGTGTHSLNGDIHASNASFWGGVFTGTHILHGTWAMGYGANLATTGTTTIASDGVWNFNSHYNTINRLYDRSFVNEGVVNHNAAHLGLNANTTITNRGTWNSVSDGIFGTFDGQTVGGLFINEGTFIKSGASTVTFGDSDNGPVFSNLGTVDVQQGALQLFRNLAQHSGTTLTGGTWIVRHGATLQEWYSTGYTVNQADVTLHGTGSYGSIATLTTNQGTLRLLDGNVFSTTVAFTNSGTLTVGAGSSFATTSSFANAGTLDLIGNFSASGGLTNTGSLSGGGAFTGSLTSGGTLAPGNSPGLLTITGNLTLLSTSELIMELGGLTEGVSYDSIEVGGALTFGGDLVVNLIDGFSPTTGTSFNLFDATSLGGTFASVSLPTLTAGLTWDTTALYSSGALSVTGTAVPEPSTYAMLTGLVALAMVTWRRGRRCRQ
ncbi:MAG: hypothetical protein IPN11_15460 [Opitutaceae bacterium]|nr:hypothetical protein [Opitutaceae bacterium]